MDGESGTNDLAQRNGSSYGLRHELNGSAPDPAGDTTSYETNLDNVEEERLVKMMRASVTKLKPEAKDVDDSTLRRFLRARQRKVDKATKMYIEHYTWRKLFVPLGYIPEGEVQNELDTKKAFIQGTDKMSRPIGIILAARHDAYKRDLEEFKRYCVYNFDKIISCMNPGVEKICLIVDLVGLKYKNLDPRGWTIIFDLMQAHYPERVGKIFLIHVPYIFWGAWKIVYPFIDKVTREKIVFVDDKNLEEVLLEEIDRDQLPKLYGGELALVPSQDSSSKLSTKETEAVV